MTEARLALDFTRCGRADSGLVWAGISLRLDGVAFPHPKWTDFIVVLLNWWSEAATVILQGIADERAVPFMEGPFSVRVKRIDESAWEVRCNERLLSIDQVRAEAVVAPRALADSIIQAGEETLNLCRTRSWWSQDADELEKHLARLQSEVR